MKKICIMLLAAIMLILSSMSAYAGVYFDNTWYTGDFESEEGAIRYIAAEKKLILNDLKITTANIYPLTSNSRDIEEIELIGESIINVTDSTCYGIYFTGTVRIYGSGSLRISAGYEPLQIKYGSLTIDGASVEIEQTGDSLAGIEVEGNIILTNGAQLKIAQENNRNDSPTIQVVDTIEISGDSRLIIDTYQDSASYGGILNAKHAKLSDTSGIEIISPAESRPDEDVYNASDVYLVNTSSNNKNVFSIDRYTSAKDNRFTVAQTVEEDGRYKLVIQGEEVAVPNEIPETGDSANLALYAIMLLLGAGALIRMKKRGNA